MILNLFSTEPLLMTWAAESEVQESLLQSRAPGQCRRRSCRVTSEMSLSRSERALEGVLRGIWNREMCCCFAKWHESSVAVLHLCPGREGFRHGWLRWRAGVTLPWAASRLRRVWYKILPSRGEERMSFDIAIPGFGRAKADRNISYMMRVSVTETGW